MEVAGLILGAYPVLILAFEQFKTGAEYFNNWRQFRRQFSGFISDIQAQQLFFEGTLQDLLCGGFDPYLPSSSKETFLRIVSDKSYSGWNDPKLEESLKSRLGKSYVWCMDTIQRIYNIFEELEEVLDIQELQSSTRTPDWWEYQWERIKKTLFVERYDKHQEAMRLISELKQMLELCDKQPQGKVQAASSVVAFLERVRINASNLHGALKDAWQCHCSSTHKALLQLEKRDQERESNFKILFVLQNREENDADDRRGINVKSGVKSSCIEREVHIRVFKEDENEKDLDETINKDQESPVKSSLPGDKLSMSSSLPNLPASSASISKKLRPLAGTANSQMNINSKTSLEKNKLKFFKGLNFKWGSKKQFSNGSLAIKKQPRETEQLAPSNTGSSLNINSKNQDALASTIGSNISMASSSATANTFNLSVARQPNASASSTNVGTESGKRVPALPSHHIGIGSNLCPQEPSQAEKPITYTANRVLDLCNTIHTATTKIHLEYLLDVNKKCFCLFLGPKSVSEQESSISLQELLEGGPRRFPPAKRVLVATILASSLLQLQRTQWIKDDWSKRDIYFRTKDGAVIFEQVYLLTEFSSSRVLGNGLLALAADMSMMESIPSIETDLTASKSLTGNTSTTAASFVTNTSNLSREISTMATSTMTNSFSTFQPLHLKTSLECLGIVLIELCLCEPIEKGEDKVSVRPHGSNIDKPNHDFCLAIANAWTWEEIYAFEPSFSDPIEMCLRFPNLGRAMQGRYDEVLQDIYAAVVKPLQDEMNRRWQPGLDPRICV